MALPDPFVGISEYDPFNPIDWDAYFGFSKRFPKSADAAAYMFLPLSHQIDKYIAAHALNRNVLDFLQWVKRNISDVDYAHVQKQFLNIEYFTGLMDSERAQAQVFSAYEKYLALPYWVHSKFRAAKRSGLDTKPPLDLLDLGCGPCHFLLVGRFLGHRPDGIDIVQPAPHAGAKGSLYESLSSLFGLKIF